MKTVKSCFYSHFLYAAAAMMKMSDSILSQIEPFLLQITALDSNLDFFIPNVAHRSLSKVLPVFIHVSIM